MDDSLPLSWSEEDGRDFSGQNVEKAKVAHEKLDSLFARPIAESYEPLCRNMSSFEANDVISKTFQRAWRARQKFRAAENPSPWLRTIAYHCYVDLVRLALKGPRITFTLPEHIAFECLSGPDLDKIKRYAYHGGSDLVSCEAIITNIADEKSRNVLQNLLERADRARYEFARRAQTRAQKTMGADFRELLKDLPKQDRDTIESAIFQGKLIQPDFDAALQRLRPEDVASFQPWIDANLVMWSRINKAQLDDKDRFIVEQWLLIDDQSSWANDIAMLLVPPPSGAEDPVGERILTVYDPSVVKELFFIPDYIETEGERRKHVKRVAEAIRQRWCRLKKRIMNNSTSDSEGDEHG